MPLVLHAVRRVAQEMLPLAARSREGCHASPQLGPEPHDTYSAHTPELPRRWLPRRCVSTMPIASMRAYMVVGPTKVKPFFLSAFERAIDSGEVVGTSAKVTGLGVSAGWNDQTNWARPPSSRNATVAAAFWMVAAILRRLRTMPASAMSRSKSGSP